MEKRKALGRGLQALIPEAESAQGLDKDEAIVYVNVNEIQPNKYQPREDFNQEKLDELMASIKEKGIVQPVLARRTEKGIELIAGERRLRAMKALGIEKVPVLLKNVDDVGAIELALIENIQREGLNPIEEAHSYKRLLDEFGFTQEKIAQTIGKDRTTVTNIIRLLGLPLEIQRYLAEGKINSGHARAILAVKGLQQQLNLCHSIMQKGLSVREAETMSEPQLRRRPKVKFDKDQHIIEQEEMLQEALGTKVRIHHTKKRGKITIVYYSPEDLQRIINIIRR